MPHPLHDRRPPSLHVETADQVSTIWIDNERQRNAMTKSMWQEFVPILDHLGTDDRTRVVVIRGLGENFSAGAAIAELEDIIADDPQAGDAATNAENAIAACPKPVVAAIDGYCIGGGWEVSGACDIRLATSRSSFGVTPAKIGIIYPLAAIERLVQIAGPGPAKDLLFTGRIITADEAYKLGLVSEMVPDSDFDDRIAALTASLTKRSQFSIQATKNIIDTIVDNPEGAAERYSLWRDEMNRSGEPGIGVSAFLTKRQPEFQWTGKEFWEEHRGRF